LTPRNPVTEKSTHRSSVGVVVVGNLPHIVVDSVFKVFEMSIDYRGKMAME
jgi:hypothetical protein